MSSLAEEGTPRAVNGTIVKIQADSVSLSNSSSLERAILLGKPLDIRNAGGRQRGRERQVAEPLAGAILAQDMEE